MDGCSHTVTSMCFKFYLFIHKWKQIHDDDNEHEDNDNDSDDDNICKLERCVSLVWNRKEHASIIKGDTLRKKQKSIITIAQVNKDGYFGMKVQNCGLIEL